MLYHQSPVLPMPDAGESSKRKLGSEETYLCWIKRFILFHGKRHPREMGVQKIQQSLSHLVMAGRVAASTEPGVEYYLVSLLERYHHASFLSMCTQHDPKDPIASVKRDQCLNNTETRTSALWHPYHGAIDRY